MRSRDVWSGEKRYSAVVFFVFFFVFHLSFMAGLGNVICSFGTEWREKCGKAEVWWQSWRCFDGEERFKLLIFWVKADLSSKLDETFRHVVVRLLNMILKKFRVCWQLTNRWQFPCIRSKLKSVDDFLVSGYLFSVLSKIVVSYITKQYQVYIEFFSTLGL